jgi:hypothetical protein
MSSGIWVSYDPVRGARGQLRSIPLDQDVLVVGHLAGLGWLLLLVELIEIERIEGFLTLFREGIKSRQRGR